MTKPSTRSLFSFVPAALVGSLMALGLACGSGDGGDSNNTGPGCTPGAQVNCDCPGGGKGVQVCSNDGRSFGACDCSNATGGTGSGGGVPITCGNGVKDAAEQCDDGNEVNTDECTNACTTPACGDGIAQAGEDCDDGNSEVDDSCPNTCLLNGGSGGAGGDPCAGQITYAGMTTPQITPWSAGGKIGKDAGDYMCQQLGADHICDYAEVQAAIAKSELASVPEGTTAWVHRTTPEMVNGQMSTPGPGGRCNEWTYATNHISDGEYVTFGAGGMATFFLDNDTFYDGVDTTHQQPGLLQCGGESRAILCCYPQCVP